MPVRGKWLVDRVEIWNMGSPVSVKLGKSVCLACSMGCCSEHSIKESDERDLITEPDEVDEERTDEFNAISTGAVQGYTLPLGMRPKRIKKKK
jgi:hypothetical protein